MDTTKDLLRAIDICDDLEYGLSALDAVYTAMEYGPNTANNFVDALHFVFLHLCECRNDLKEALISLQEAERDAENHPGDAAPE